MNDLKDFYEQMVKVSVKVVIGMEKVEITKTMSFDESDLENTIQQVDVQLKDVN